MLSRQHLTQHLHRAVEVHREGWSEQRVFLAIKARQKTTLRGKERSKRLSWHGNRVQRRKATATKTRACATEIDLKKGDLPLDQPLTQAE